MVIRKAEPAGERVLALGTFDGVHLGHKALLDAGKQYAQQHGILLRACSFDRHPLEVIRPEIAPKLLTVPEEKEEWMERFSKAGRSYCYRRISYYCRRSRCIHWFVRRG